MSYYVYKHVAYNGDIIYVGQTKNLGSRTSVHKSNSNWFNLVEKIEYAEVTDRILMNIYEKLYIDKYSPIYNKKDIHCEYSRFFKNMEELVFKEYIHDAKITKKFIGDYTSSIELITKVTNMDNGIAFCIPMDFIEDIENYKKGVIIFPCENGFEVVSNSKENSSKVGFKIVTKTLVVNKTFIKISINKYIRNFYNIYNGCNLKIKHEDDKIKVMVLVESTTNS